MFSINISISIMGLPIASAGGVSYTVYWDSATASSFTTLSSGDVIATMGDGSSTTGTCVATVSKNGDKWYWEVVPNSTADSEFFSIGIALSTFDTTTYYVGTTADSWAYNSDGTKQTNAFSGDAYGASYTGGDVIGIALDASAGTVEFFKNDISQGVAFTGIAGTIFPALSCTQVNLTQGVSTAHFDASTLTYSLPSGYKALDQAADAVWASGVWAATLWASDVWYAMTRTAAVVPDTMIAPTASAGDTEADIYFTALANDDDENGGGTITGYTATSTPGSITGTGTSSPITVTGLTNATAYTFTVHATNFVGNSSESPASNSVTPTASGDPEFSAVSPSSDGTDVTITFTTATDISSGVAGILYDIGIGAQPIWWTDVAGEVANQSIVIPYTELGAVTGDTITYQVGYSATNPAGTKEYSIAVYSHELT